MEYSERERYWIWLSSVDGIGPRRFYRLLAAYEEPRAVWEHVNDAGLGFLGAKVLGALRRARSEDYLSELLGRLGEKGLRAVTRISDEYPARLTRTVDAPATLYVRGRADLNHARPFAIVGSRRCTRDGERAAGEFAERLSREGVTVVSGLALGIDAAAHRGAVKAHAPTVAVLGCGADRIYPAEHAGLAEQILEDGGSIVSEYLPGTPPLATNFPARNRIISGMSRGVLIVEGSARSGAMITVNDALDQGRDVFALPGSVYSALSEAPNRLIVDGAVPAITPWDILEYYRWAQRPSGGEKERRREEPELTDEERAVVMPLKEQSLTLSELKERTGMESKDLISLLTMLELRGIIEKRPGGEYRA